MLRFLKYISVAVAFLTFPSVGYSQCSGQFGSGQTCANATGSQGLPKPTSETALFDFLYGSTPGTIIYRGPGGWSSLPGNNSGTQVLSENASGVPAWIAASGTGTVTSVGLSLPGIFTVSGSPVVGSGTLTGTLASQSQNLVWASPNGSSGTPTFRGIVLGDFPTIGSNTALVNATAGSAVPTAQSVPSCSTSNSALIWTTNTGFGCNSITTTLASIAADNALVNSTGSPAPPIATPLGSCSAAQNALTYNTTTHAFGCNTISGSGTVVVGTGGQLAWYAGNGNVVNGNVDANISNGTLTLGLANTTLGSLVLEGSTSGALTISPQATASTPTWTAGTSSGTPAVTASAPLAISSSTGNISVTGVAGQVLGGSGPAFTATPTLGASSVATGQLKLAGTTSGTVTFSVQDAAGTWTMKLPTSGGSAGQFLSTDGSGNASWSSPAGGGTVNAGTAGQMAYYATSSAAVSGNSSANISSGALTLGQASSVQGSVVLEGGTSGALTLTTQAAAGTPTWTAGTASGTPAVTASAPLAIASATGNISITGQVPLANGGTNANLTASNGGIFYSTGSAGAILSGTATANRALLSGSSSAPSWSTATYPPTTTANQLLYSSSTNTIAGLATANNAALITDGSGVPSLQAFPAVVNPSSGNFIGCGLPTAPAVIWSNCNPQFNADAMQFFSTDPSAGVEVVLGGTVTNGDVISLTIAGTTVTATAGGGDTLNTMAGKLACAIANNATLFNLNGGSCSGGVVTPPGSGISGGYGSGNPIGYVVVNNTSTMSAFAFDYKSTTQVTASYSVSGSATETLTFPSGWYSGPSYLTANSTGGSANAQTLVLGGFSLVTYANATFTAGFSNSGSTTLNIQSTGVKTVQKLVAGVLTNLSTGDIVSGTQYTVAYNGTVYILGYNSVSVAGGSTVSTTYQLPNSLDINPTMVYSRFVTGAAPANSSVVFGLVATGNTSSDLTSRQLGFGQISHWVGNSAANNNQSAWLFQSIGSTGVYTGGWWIGQGIFANYGTPFSTSALQDLGAGTINLPTQTQVANSGIYFNGLDSISSIPASGYLQIASSGKGIVLSGATGVGINTTGSNNTFSSGLGTFISGTQTPTVNANGVGLVGGSTPTITAKNYGSSTALPLNLVGSYVSVNLNTSTITPQAGTILQLLNVDGSSTLMGFDAYGTGADGVVSFRAARGTAASPSNLSAADAVGSIAARPFTNGSFTSASTARLDFTFTDTSPGNGTSVDIFATPNGGSRSQVARFSGTLGLGTTSFTASPGEFVLAKISDPNTAPGAGNFKITAEAGTNAGTCKIVARAGTSATAVLIVDNVGSGC